MKILTWNINGIRAVSEPLNVVLNKLNADIICLQETKITRCQRDEQSMIVEGYNSYFSYCKSRNGYSGTAIFVKDNATPVRAEEGLSNVLTDPSERDTIGCYPDNNYSYEELRKIDWEGRAVLTQHSFEIEGSNEIKDLVIINVYCPRAGESEERQEYKMQFYNLLQARAECLINDGKHVIILGDFNTSHRKIDVCDSEDIENFENKPDRKWLVQLLDSSSSRFVDTFRKHHPNEKEAYTCWKTTTSARETNYGARIDYIVCDKELSDFSIDCIHLTDFQGSDHCPVRCDFSIQLVPSKKCPSLCSKYHPEFSGRQQKLMKYLVADKRNSVDVTESSSSKKPKLVKKPSSGKNATLATFFPRIERKEAVEVKDVPSHSQEISSKASEKQSVSSNAWKKILKGPDTPPLCKGHNEQCVLRTVKKQGPTKGKQFYVCSRPEGSKSNKKARCEHFEWKISKLKS